eukprot:3937956-Rhodomonas_salina.2
MVPHKFCLPLSLFFLGAHPCCAEASELIGESNAQVIAEASELIGESDVRGIAESEAVTRAMMSCRCRNVEAWRAILCTVSHQLPHTSRSDSKREENPKPWLLKGPSHLRCVSRSDISELPAYDVAEQIL